MPVNTQRPTSRPRLAREIAFWLAIKLALLTLIYFLFFRPELKPVVDTASHILG